ncbi:MAG: hypothetical protein CSA47_00850 [Gammaproteobacteria bacterium]|nr:MAG: hypothetical protein CSA47_00850 [Gammaproteobacteria bacterium]
MFNFLFQRQWGWKTSGVALALAFLLAVFLVKPIGVSTQFVILDGIIWDAISPDVVVDSADKVSGYASSNAYLNKSGGKYAKHIANPWNYSFIFVIAMLVGGFLASLLKPLKVTQIDSTIDQVRIDAFEKMTVKRYLLAFIGGVLVLFGARLAGGCTSGHMMSGMMQTSLSGYLFAAAAFVVAIPTAIMVYGRGK